MGTNVNEQELKTKKRTNWILKNLNKVKDKEFKSLHKTPMMFQKYNPKLINAEEGLVDFEFVVLENMVNPLGFFHGGIQCVLFDDIIAIAAATLGNDAFSITANLQVHYLGKCKLNDIIRIEAEVVREGRSRIYVEARMVGVNGKTISTANSDLLLTNISRDYPKKV
ncbi:MAG: PaaI family thioesterase [Promethearchaeota archaeon]